MEFIESERGNQKLSYQGFLYVKQKNLANGVVSWECEKTSGKILKLHVNYIVQ